MEDAVFVIGHRHPDTDSVGSAIALADLRNVLGDGEVRPARAGELNRETRYVLDRFALPTPELLTTATGRRLILVDHNEVAQALTTSRTPPCSKSGNTTASVTSVSPAPSSFTANRWVRPQP